ncbi:Ig-like domain-containing protein [Halodesulfurarchaeum formicicum]|uniref:Uncharacterized protein n=1 Tax=Halodesulfurarchaeum formicicum TaxID=1873524 RepID=A0A1J1AC47_9EURY|nr:Ig-like domain-containing protein [Halodesulfurarchaeum formicicum]APE95722.1 hypothetical protein HSR6_1278 [Halodesulfurarchaeum formicicum]
MPEGRSITGLVVLLVTVSMVASPTLVSVAEAADTPQIQVSVNENTIEDGAWTVVGESDFSIRIASNATIESIVVRVNDRDVVEATPDGRTYQTDLVAPLSARWNTVQVVATDTSGTLSTHQFKIYKDTIAPDIAVSSPFSVAAGHQFPEETRLTDGAINLTGTVEDASNVTAFSATLSGAGQSIELTNHTDGSFTLNTTLAPGNHTLSVRATDEYGNEVRRFTRLRVIDEDAPSVSIRDWPTNTSAGAIGPTAVATDDIAVRSLTYRVSGQPERTAIEPTSRLLGAGRTNVTRSIPIEFYRAGTYEVTFNVTDYAGRYTTLTKELRYDPVTPEERAAPEITVHENRSGLVNETLYHLEASVDNGSIERVVLEAASNSSGRVSAYERVYDGNATATVPVRQNLSLASGVTDITLTATDSYGTEHSATWQVDPESTSPYRTSPAENTATGPDPTVEPSSQSTEISVTEPTPLAPVTETKAPASPVLVAVALLVVSGLLSRRRH